MTVTIISNNSPYTFGQQVNQAISRLVTLNTQMARLGEAVTTASAGYEGEPGTQFEAPPGLMTAQPPNLFGVQPDPDKPGEQGQTFRYAMDQLVEAWKDFWVQARPYVEQLDNGGNSI